MTAPTPYDDILAVLDNLPVLVRETRRRKGASMREVGRQTGMAASTVMRVEKGIDCSLENAKVLLRWAAS